MWIYLQVLMRRQRDSIENYRFNIVSENLFAPILRARLHKIEWDIPPMSWTHELRSQNLDLSTEISSISESKSDSF
jgi:hypothetical protein